MSERPQVMTPELGEVPVFPKASLSRRDWRDGLLIRSPNWLGDAAMASPAIAQLKKSLPSNCGLFVACPKPLAPVFKSLLSVDLVIPLRNAHAFPSFSEMGSLRRLQAGACLILNNSFRDALALKLCGIPRIYGAAARFRSPLLEASYSFPKRLDRVLNKPHQAAKYLAMAYALGAPGWDGSPPEASVFAAPETMSDEVLRAMRMTKVMAIAAGAAYGDAKRWSAPNFRAVAAWWIENGGSVVALGSASERAIAEEAVQGLPEESCMNLAGGTGLDHLMALLKMSDVCLANDSGVMHLAAMLGVKGVAVFGSTDPAATSPLSKGWRMIFDKQDCAPCFKRRCPEGTKRCLASIGPVFVIEEIEKLCASACD